MVFKTLANFKAKGYSIHLLAMFLLRKPFIYVRWSRELDDFYLSPLDNSPHFWIEFSMEKDNGKKL